MHFNEDFARNNYSRPYNLACQGITFRKTTLSILVASIPVDQGGVTKPTSGATGRITQSLHY